MSFSWRWSVRKTTDGGEIESGSRKFRGSARTKAMIRAEMQSGLLEDALADRTQVESQS